MALAQGQVIKDRYRVAKILGQNEFVAVYRAWDLDINSPCALEEISDVSGELQPAFSRRVSQLFNLRHPSLPRVLDAFTVTGQGHYLVVEFMEGENLQTMLEGRGEPLPETQTLEWIDKVCETLSYMHSQEPPIIHNNLKPDNILIVKKSPSTQGQPTLVGFGAASVCAPDIGLVPGVGAARTGFSPPEMYGQGVIGVRSDVYMLGATLYQLLTGIRLAESPLILRREVGEPKPVNELNPQISPEVSAAIGRAIQINPAERFENIEAFKAALAGQPSAPVPPPVVPAEAVTTRDMPPVPAAIPTPAVPPAPAEAPKRKRRWPLVVGGVVVGILLIAGLLMGGRAVVGMIAERSATETPTPSATYTPLPTLAPTNTFTPSPPTATPTPEISASPTSELGYVEDDFGVPMVLISEDGFRMGSDWGAPEEKPVHDVKLDAYYIDVYEVTNARYSECEKAGACDPPLDLSSSTRTNYYGNLTYDQYPVIHVSWDMARDYCEWRGGRLPTEAEWEKAAKGTAGTSYPWGNEIDCTYANFWSDQGGCEGDTSAVGAYPEGESPYGLFDMIGNVWEWVQDWYDEEYYAISPSENPTGPESGELRVLRGGAWDGGGMQARVVTRGRNQDFNARKNIGIRCVRTP